MPDRGRAGAWMRASLRDSGSAEAVWSRVSGAVDRLERAVGRGDPLVPPRHLRTVGGGDFSSVGDLVLSQLIAVGGLQRDARVLDVGCGSGRVAIPLTRYLSTGSYTGFDVSAAAITWCQTELTSRFPSFRFDHLDVTNGHYNRGGQIDAAAVRLPYADGSFDFAFATSVFTHLLPGQIIHYADELSRVLTADGVVFATFFLLTPASESRIASGAADIELPAVFRDEELGLEYRAMEARRPERAVAFPEMFVQRAFGPTRWSPPRVHPGSWSGGGPADHYQDVVIAHRLPD
jgi:SAM-dependent methyltransferase